MLNLYRSSIGTVIVWMMAVWAFSGAMAEEFLVHSFHSEEGLPSNNIRSIAQASDGYLWIATAEGVVLFDGVRFTSAPWQQGVAQSSQPPRALFALDSGDVWITTIRGELWRWSEGMMTKVWKDAGDDQESQRVIRIVGVGGSGVWIECEVGMYRASSDNLPVRVENLHELPKDQKTSRVRASVVAPTGGVVELMDHRERLWKWSAATGLVVSEKGEGEQAVREMPSVAVVTALLEDREGNLWAGTNGNGLYQIRSRRVQVIDTADGITDQRARALLEDHTGTLWVANRSGGIDRLRKGGVESFSFGDRDKQRVVASICEDREGVLWAAKENGSVYRRTSHGFETLTEEKPWVRRVEAIIADEAGAVWLGGANGLAVWRQGEVEKFGDAQGIPEQQINSLALDERQNLWVGTAAGLIYLGRENHFTLVGKTVGAVITTLLPDKDGGVWAATLGGGLFLVKGGSQTRFALDEGLPEARLTCVLDDGAGCLWLGSLSGIFRVAKAELLEIAAGRRAKANWLHLDRADGMTSRECTGAFQPAGWRGRDGRLWFPTVHGIVAIRPAGFELNLVPPLVRIEDAAANGRSVGAPTSEVRTGPGRTRLEFHYTGLSFSAPEKVRFRTRLEGLEKEWQETVTQRVVAYEAVPPGKYVFRVMAANNDGVWSETSASLAVRVLPHYWETLWFRTGTVLGVIALAVWIGAMIARARARMNLLRLQAQTARLLERERIAQDLHDDLGASLTEISLLAGLAAEEQNGAQGRYSIPDIATKAQRLVSTLDEIVWAVNPRHDTLASFVEYLTASAAELLGAADIALRLDVAKELPEREIDSVHRHALFLAAREALNNAVKHSGASEVRLGIHYHEDELEISVQDNGKGFVSQASGQSDGLRNMHARLADTGGHCRIESSGRGTTVLFSLALGKSV